MRPQITLKTLRLALAVAAALPLLVYGAYQSLTSVDQALKQASNELVFSATLVASAQEQTARTAQQLLVLVAQSQLSAGSLSNKPRDCSAYLSALVARLPQYASIAIASSNGYVSCHSSGTKVPIYVGDRSYFEQAVATRQFAVGRYSLGQVPSLPTKPTIEFALPVMAADSSVSAVVFVSLSLQTFAEQISKAPVPEGERLVVADSAGVILAMNPVEHQRVGNSVHGALLGSAIKARRAGVQVGEDLEANHQRRIYAFQAAGQPLSQPFFVAVSRDREVVVAPARRALLLNLVDLLVAALLGSALVGTLASRGLIAPTQRILAATRRMQNGERSVRIPVLRHPLTAEFSSIADGFNLMANALEQRERELQNELARSRQAFSTLDLTINSMKEGLIAVDTHGQVLLFNQAAATLFVMDNAPKVDSGRWPQHHGLFVPGTDRLYATENLPLMKAIGGQSGSTQHIWVRNARQPEGRLISCSYRPMQGDAGRTGEAPPAGALMVFSDITQLQKMQLEQAKGLIALNESQRRLVQAQRLGRMGNWELDLVTQALWVSDELYVIFGLNADSLNARHETLIELVHPDDRAGYDALRQALWQDGSAFETEYRIITPAGDVRWIFHAGTAADGPHGPHTIRSSVVRDITIRKIADIALTAANEELAATQRKLLNAQQLGHIGNWEFEPTTQALRASPEVFALFGLCGSADAVPFETLRGLIHPDDAATYAARASAAQATGTELDLEYRIIRPDGEVRWMHQIGKSYDDRLGKIPYRAGVVQDITDRKKAELVLAESYTRLSHAQDKLVQAQRVGGIGSWELDLATGAFFASAQFYAICGVADQSLGLPELLLLLHPDDREAYLSATAAADEQSGQIQFDAQYRVVTPAGNVRWIQQMSRIERNAVGAAVRRMGVIQDITESKLAKLVLADNLDVLKRTGELAKIGGWELRLDTGSLRYSDQVRRIHELEDFEEHTPEDAVMAYAAESRQQFIDATTRALADGQAWDLELPLVTRKGRRLWVRSQGQAMQDNAHTRRLVGTLQDITEQYQSRQLLRLLQTSMNRLTDVVMVSQAEPQAGALNRALVYVNEAFERFTGYTSADMLGHPPIRLDGPLTDRQTLRELTDALRARRTHRCELYGYKKSGEAAWVELDIVPIVEPAGRVSHWVWVGRELTSRKAAEQALLQSEQRYMALFEAAPLPLWVFDEDTLAFLAVNEAAVQQYGHSREEFLSLNMLDICPQSERPWLKDHLSQPFVHGSLTVRHQRKNGAEFYAQVIARPIRYQGHAGRFVVALDVSDRFKAEKNVRDQLFTQQRAADAAQAITAHQTLKGALQEVADQACGVIGAHQARVLLTESQAWAPSLHGVSLSEKYAGYRPSNEAVNSIGIYAVIFETKRSLRLTQAELQAHPRAAQADAGLRMRGWLAVPLVGRNGTCIGVLQLSDKFEGDFTLLDEYLVVEMAQLAATALENVRLFDEIRELNAGLEQKVVERTADLGRQEALFRALADEAPQAIWTVNADSNVTYFNRALLSLVGGDKDSWLGQRWLELIHPEDLPNLLETWALAVQTRSRYANIRRFRDKNEHWRIMSCTASPVFAASGEVEFWVGIDTDITDIKATEAALRLSNQELEAFSYSVSHDLRSPLNTIDGFSRLLNKQLAHTANEKSQHYLARIQAGVAQMGQLIEDLLSLAQVSRMQLRFECVDLSALSHKILGEWRNRAPTRRVNVTIADELIAFGDARLLRVVMENLLGNAWKFTAQREVAEITVGQQLNADAQRVFFVADNGAGFDMAYVDKLFTAFQRLHGPQEFAGSGIGLATVGRVIGRHRGRLWTDAKVNEGAQFYFTLPNSAPNLPSGVLPN